MIIFNNGIPKSGTSLLFAYQKDMVEQCAGVGGMEAFSQHSYGGFLHKVDENSYKMMRKLHRKHGSFVVKIHSTPNKWILKLLEEQIAKLTCSFRDPRDVILSAIDHGERTRRGEDSSGAFKGICTLEDGVRSFKNWVGIFDQWNEIEGVMMIGYEYLI